VFYSNFVTKINLFEIFDFEKCRNLEIWVNKQNVGNRTLLSDGRKKEIYRDVQFFRGAIQLSAVNFGVC